MTRSTPKPTTSDSTITSLGELMRLEKERLADVERDRLRDHEAKLRADEDAAQRLMAAEEEARKTIAREVAAREERERVVAARLLAEEKATIERERVRAVEASRESERQKERDHELSVKRLELQAAAEKSPIATLAGYGLALVVLLGAVATELVVVGPGHDRKLADVSEVARQNGVALEAAKAERATQQGRADGATRDLAESRARIAALEKELAQLASARHPKSAPGAAPASAPAPSAKTEETCIKGDPLCKTIERP